MALFPASALRSGVRKREVFGWAMYDFANSGYTTVVITAVFAAYFVGGIAKGAPWAAFAWTAALSTSYAIVMLTMPAIGAWADQHAAKKRVLMFATAGCVLATIALAVTPRFTGLPGVALAMALIWRRRPGRRRSGSCRRCPCRWSGCPGRRVPARWARRTWPAWPCRR
ncbi:hypothetical protein VVAX_02735 [Variovorax paradoxus]|uniref:Major facilitator superfamily (MFS) profile domain-containing protein n=1 Tax=Variovorax paradoxus TaxID=34073 RepID=A0A679JET2_VARPD|nr:hypothetical protein VVAX_02735 [Variovorax paradoxus]